MIFRDKKILIGISGGIAAYKVCYLIRSIKKQGGSVRAILTTSGERFVTPVTLEALSGEPAARDQFDPTPYGPFPHIDLPKWADCFVVAPATANILAKAAQGIADDLLSTSITAARGTILFAPAMNDAMWENKATQDNVAILQGRRHRIILPGSGDLACETVGIGRMAEPEEIERSIVDFLGLKRDLEGKRILVTAGGTEEPIDPVRFIGNRSSGRMGFALAEVACARGADVVLIAGSYKVALPANVRVIKVRTAAEMAQAVQAEISDADALLMAAAVADFRPESVSGHKIKKEGSEEVTLRLGRTEDILAKIGSKKLRKSRKKTALVGFALETENGEENARKKLAEKNLDMIILNNPLENGAGFDVETNKVSVFERGKKRKDLPVISKRDVADHILDRVAGLLK